MRKRFILFLMDPFEKIQQFNAGRDPERLALKYAAMAQQPSVFFRGSCHLFYEDWHATLRQSNSPAAWICGDMHLENVGSFKADNGLVYFDLNDFDECALAPCGWELARLVTSLLLARRLFKLSAAQIAALSERLIDGYASALANGKAKWVERKTARGDVKTLLSTLSKRSDKAFLADRIHMVDQVERLIIDGKRTLSLKKPRKKQALDRFMRAMQVTSKQDFYYPLDIARRIAGTGSLGVERYVVLVAGKGPGKRALMDMKASQPSALTPYLHLPQPEWPTEAQRIVTIQSGAQILAPDGLHAVRVDGLAYVIKALQPSQDRLDLSTCHKQPAALGPMIDTMAQVSAWGHLRNAGFLGAANRESLMQFGAAAPSWKHTTLNLAHTMAQHTMDQWRAYQQAYVASLKKPRKR